MSLEKVMSRAEQGWRIAAAAPICGLSAIFGFSAYYSFTAGAQFHELAYGSTSGAYNNGLQFLGLSLITLAAGAWFVWPLIKKYAAPR